MFKTLALVGALMLVTQTVAAADQPLRERQHTDVDIPAIGASAVCGFPIRIHAVGDSNFTLFYDNQGNIIREIDTFPSWKITVYRPGTDIGYTTASPAVVTFHYTNGAAIGSSVTGTVTGLVQRIPGIDLDGGRFVFTGFVRGYDAAGVPLVTFTAQVSTTGPDLDAPQPVQRCAYFQ